MRRDYALEIVIGHDASNNNFLTLHPWPAGGSHPESNLVRELPGSNFFKIRRYFSNIGGNSADTAINRLRNARCAVIVELLQRIKVDSSIFLRKTVIPADVLQKNTGTFFSTDAEKKLAQ